MTNNTTEKSVIGKIKMKVGEWKYITTESFCSLYEENSLLWTSIDSNIVKVNPNSGLLYASDIGTTTVFATDINGTDIKLICYIEVEFFRPDRIRLQELRQRKPYRPSSLYN